MRDNKLHTPVGVRDILPEECGIKDVLLGRLKRIFWEYGYQTVESPMFEYVEVFSDEKQGGTEPRQMYKFFDRDGSTLALRADMTPPIARIAATAYKDAPRPLRFSYTGSVFRYNENYQGKMREFSQGGVELIGINSVDADAEVIAVAVNCLLACGLKEFKINIGQVEFFKGILEETGLAPEICQNLQEMIGRRDYVASEALLESIDLDGNIKKLLLELPKLVGTLDMLEYAKTLTENPMALQALAHMEELYRILELYKIDSYIVFDLGMVNKLNYYTGIIFRGYTYGTGISVVDGGRYDNLVGQYGCHMPAVGFGLRVSEIITALDNQNIPVSVERAGTLVAYHPEGKATALAASEIFREDGLPIENSLLGADLEANVAYAQAKKMERVLYFKDSVHVTAVIFAPGVGAFDLETTIDEIYRVLEGEKS